MDEVLKHPISYSDPTTGVNFTLVGLTFDNHGIWQGTFTDPNGEEVEILLFTTERASTPQPTQLALIRTVMNELSTLRAQAIALVKQDVANDLDKWGLVDENDVPFWEIYDDMLPWNSMTEAEYDAEFRLMGLTIPQDAVMPDEFVLGFWSDLDVEHGVGVRFKSGGPVEALSWCYFF